MEDDLILNIDLDSHIPVKKPSSKGGRWVDRMKVKRTLKRKAQDPQTNQHTVASPLTEADRRSTKRPRKEAPSSPEPKPISTLTRPAQFISSLFTSNPKITTQSTSKSVPKLPPKPSNAPLDSCSFSGLGLHPLIVSHLIKKMNIQKPTAIQRSAFPALLAPSQPGAERDAFIQSQTGSGKTLSYLLPIIHDLLPLSSLSYIDRSIGTLAIIIAPTRELAKQISDVLEALLKLRLRLEEAFADNPTQPSRLTRWLVSGLLIGGENRAHEKARLRKGIPILVSTPGRLLDHLQNTSSLNVGKCRWLVLDEADRLMELGFEETITGILKCLEGRQRLGRKAAEEGKSVEVGGWNWEHRRRTILCSATIREDVQKLAGTALVDPLILKPIEIDNEPGPTVDEINAQPFSPKFTPPSQLAQKYVVTPLKLRLVTLLALLRSFIMRAPEQQSTRIIVFFSCTDSVDFHWNLLVGTSVDTRNKFRPLYDGDGASEPEYVNRGKVLSSGRTSKGHYDSKCAFLPGASIYRLHGSLPTQARLSVVKRFTDPSKKFNDPSILLCTSVASRGLDLPLVRAVVQYDLPTEGGATEYIHRVGRTARAGKGGEAWAIVAPSETNWVRWVEEMMRGGDQAESQVNKGSVSLTPVAMEEILRSGFGGKEQEYEEHATEAQLAFERWVLREKENSELARHAFLSHLRAYATHPSSEKHIFHIRHLHLGHLAKAFALREAPKSITGSLTGSQKAKNVHSVGKRTKIRGGHQPHKGRGAADRDKDTEQRMQSVVRAQGRLTKKGGFMLSSGASEFQIQGGDGLERLVWGS